jgi:hypothetical protein
MTVTCDTEEIGQPYVRVQAKRSFDDVVVEVDWHDYLARQRRPGTAYAVTDAVRPLRARATGLQYRCSTGGVTSGAPSDRIRWPAIVGGTVTDGSVVWTAEAVNASSLRTTISTEDWTAVTGLTLGTESSSDLRYHVIVGGGVSGQTYEVRHRVTLANGEDKEAVAVLPVQD